MGEFSFTSSGMTGKDIFVLRTEKGLSLRQLAALSGVPASTIADIEHERTDPRWSAIQALVAVLGTPKKRTKR